MRYWVAWVSDLGMGNCTIARSKWEVGAWGKGTGRHCEIPKILWVFGNLRFSQRQLGIKEQKE
jgi:hypothetical protein